MKHRRFLCKLIRAGLVLLTLAGAPILAACMPANPPTPTAYVATSTPLPPTPTSFLAPLTPSAEIKR